MCEKYSSHQFTVHSEPVLLVLLLIVLCRVCVGRDSASIIWFVLNVARLCAASCP